MHLLADFIKNYPLGLRHLVLSNTGMSLKVYSSSSWACLIIVQSSIAFGQAISGNHRMQSVFETLDVSNNNITQVPSRRFIVLISQDGITALLGLLENTNILTTLNLQNSGAFVDSTLLLLSAAVTEHLAVLHLGENKFTSK